MRVSVFYLHGGGGAIITLLLSLMPTTDADDEKDGERKLTPR